MHTELSFSAIWFAGQFPHTRSAVLVHSDIMYWYTLLLENLQVVHVWQVLLAVGSAYVGPVQALHVCKVPLPVFTTTVPGSQAVHCLFWLNVHDWVSAYPKSHVVQA